MPHTGQSRRSDTCPGPGIGDGGASTKEIRGPSPTISLPGGEIGEDWGVKGEGRGANLKRDKTSLGSGASHEFEADKSKGHETGFEEGPTGLKLVSVSRDGLKMVL